MKAVLYLLKEKQLMICFHIRTEDFETYPYLSDLDREDIRNFLRNTNVVID